jgi:hypothetical protein
LFVLFLLPIVLSVLLRFTASDYLFGIFCPLYYLYFFDLRLLNISLVYSHICPLYCLSFDLRLLITSLVSFAHCIVCPSIYGFWLPLWYLHPFAHWIVCPSWIYGFWLPFWHLLPIVMSVLRFTASDYLFGIFTLLPIALSVLRFTASDYLFGIFCPLYCLSFDLRLLITSFVSFTYNALSVLLRFTASDYIFGIFKLFLPTVLRMFRIWFFPHKQFNLLIYRLYPYRGEIVYYLFYMWFYGVLPQYQLFALCCEFCCLVTMPCTDSRNF